MHIQSYQIHNVLNVYRRQLSQVKTDLTQPGGTRPTESDSATISSEGNNKSVMEKVTANVLKKITNVDPGTDLERTKTGGNDLGASEKESEFVFNTIVENNQKETRSIAIDNSRVLMRRLDELAKAAISRESE
jgi:hypothetical protein